MGGAFANVGFFSLALAGGLGLPHGDGPADAEAEADGLRLEAAIVLFDFVSSWMPNTRTMAATTIPTAPSVRLQLTFATLTSLGLAARGEHRELAVPGSFRHTASEVTRCRATRKRDRPGCPSR